MSECGCSQTNLRFEGLSKSYKRILWLVIIINAAMFFIEITAGFKASSMALRADALDFLGDTVTYLISFWVIGASLKYRATAALFKSASLGLFGLWVFSETLYRVFVEGLPVAPIMGTVAVAALLANVISVLLLYKYRNGDSNIRSVWLCSRNDAVGNVGVIIAAFLVNYTDTRWPDLTVALLISFLFCSSALSIFKQARSELKEAAHEHH